MVEMTPEPIDRGFVLTSLRHFIDGLELDFARFAAEFAAGQQWAEEGFNSPADWMRFNCHMNSNTAWNALTVGGQIEKLAKPMGEHDDRTREQRLADAAVELASGRKPATIQVTATVDTLKAMAGAAGGEMEFSMPLPAAAVQRLACDSNVMRVILDAA